MHVSSSTTGASHYVENLQFKQQAQACLLHYCRFSKIDKMKVTGLLALSTSTLLPSAILLL